MSDFIKTALLAGLITWVGIKAQTVAFDALHSHYDAIEERSQ